VSRETATREVEVAATTTTTITEEQGRAKGGRVKRPKRRIIVRPLTTIRRERRENAESAVKKDTREQSAPINE
jgi:hypothetical protein